MCCPTSTPSCCPRRARRSKRRATAPRRRAAHAAALKNSKTNLVLFNTTYTTTHARLRILECRCAAHRTRAAAGVAGRHSPQSECGRRRHAQRGALLRRVRTPAGAYNAAVGAACATASKRGIARTSKRVLPEVLGWFMVAVRRATMQGGSPLSGRRSASRCIVRIGVRAGETQTRRCVVLWWC